jgi:hypothetical protein
VSAGARFLLTFSGKKTPRVDTKQGMRPGGNGEEL